MPCLLCLECSSQEGSIALVEDSPPPQQDLVKPLAFKKWRMDFGLKQAQNSHSERLVVEIEQALKEAKKGLSSLSAIGLSIGPGRWTGLRAGSMVAKSLSFCLNIPICPVNSHRVFAEEFLSAPEESQLAIKKSASSIVSPSSADKGRVVLVAMNGFKNQIYFSKFYPSEEEAKIKTEDQIGDQTEDQTGIKTENQIGIKIEDQAEQKTENQIGIKIEDQAWQKPEDQIGDQTATETLNNKKEGCSIGEETSLLPFSVYVQQMEELIKKFNTSGAEDLKPKTGETEKTGSKTETIKKPICVSDLMDFYPLPPQLKKAFLWKRPKPSALHLAKMILRQKSGRRKMLNWREVSLLYLRSPTN